MRGKLEGFYSETLTKDPQQVWQTLKNFDYPFRLTGFSHFCIISIPTSSPHHSPVNTVTYFFTVYTSTLYGQLVSSKIQFRSTYSTTFFSFHKFLKITTRHVLNCPNLLRSLHYTMFLLIHGVEMPCPSAYTLYITQCFY